MPLTHGFVVLTVVILLHRLLATLTGLSHRLENLAEGEPLLVVEKGRINEEALRGGTLSRHELLMELRLRGVRDVGEVELAFFEPSGQMTVLLGRRERQETGESTLPPQFEARV